MCCYFLLSDLDDYTLTDSHPECSEWAKSGECEANPRWMIPNCQKSCDTCSYEMPSEESTVSVVERAQTEPEVANTSRNASFSTENTTLHQNQNSSITNATHPNLKEEQTVESQSETGSSEPNSGEPISSETKSVTYQSRTHTYTGETTNNTRQADISSQRTTTTGSILLDAITAISRT